MGYVIGELNRGLQYMFIMMNAARFASAFRASAWPSAPTSKPCVTRSDRVQSRAQSKVRLPAVAIIEHPDVRRMLMSMRAQTEGARAWPYVDGRLRTTCARIIPTNVRAQNQAFLRIPGADHQRLVDRDVARSHLDWACRVHGGMGFIEETGAAQHYRDARILTIYEGTTAIQANDLIGRKTVRDGGATAYRIVEDIRKTVDELERSKHASLVTIGARLEMAVEAYAQTIQFVLEEVKDDVRGVYAGSVAYLMLAGYVHGGWQMARAAQAAVKKIEAGDLDPFYETKLVTARFYAEHLLPRALSLHASVVDGAESVLALGADQF
jgi:hypothetical protein